MDTCLGSLKESPTLPCALQVAPTKSSAYRSTLRQLMLSHPTVFSFESVLGLFTDTYTFSFITFCGLRRLILGITPSFLWHYLLIQVRLLLLNPSYPTTSYGLIPTRHCWRCSWVTSFLHIIGLSSLGFICPPVWTGDALLEILNLVIRCPSRCFGGQGVA